jgi:predicted Zn finger-like uncharacterized protein
VRIICPNCRSEYEFDASRVSGKGTKVKCSSCEHVFMVYRVEESVSVESPLQEHERPRRKIGKLTGERLMLRQEDKVYTVRNLALLQRWIVEKRVLATDEVSIDGDEWELVSRLSELRPFFTVLRSLRETRRELQHTRDRLRATLEMRAVEPDEIPEVHPTGDVMAHMGPSLVDEAPVSLAHPSVGPTQPDPEDASGPDPHSEESVDRAMAADLGIVDEPPPPIEPPSDLVGGFGGRLAADEGSVGVERPSFSSYDPDEAVEPESAEFKARPLDFVSPEVVGSGEHEEVVGRRDPLSEQRDRDRRPSAGGIFAPPQDEDTIESAPVPDSGPIPRSARDAISEMTADSTDPDPPYYDPAAQSVVTGSLPRGDEPSEPSERERTSLPPLDFDAAMGSVDDASEDGPADEPDEQPLGAPPIDFDSALGSLEDEPSGSGEESAPLDEPEPAVADEDSAPAFDEPIDFNAALGSVQDVEGDPDDGLGADFETFESSFEGSFPSGSVDEEWEGDDFSQRFEDTFEDDADDKPGLPLVYIIGGAVVIVALIVGTWFVVKGMRDETRSLADMDAEGEVGDVETPTSPDVEPATPEEPDGAADGEDENTGDEGQGGEVDGEAPTEAAEPTTAAEDEPPTPAEEIEEPTPEPPTPEPVTPNDGIDWGDSGEEATEAPAANVNHAAHAAELGSSGQHDKAIQEYLRAFVSDPNNATTRKAIGWSYIEIGNNNEAAKHFRKAVLLDSMDPETHYGLGLAYEMLGRNGDAINEYESYLGLAPNGREATEVRILLKRLIEIESGG